MINIVKYDTSRKDEACALSVKPEQAEFTVGRVSEALNALEEHEHPHLVVSDNQVVGFFILDTGYPQSYEFCPRGSLGVRALLIDQRFQGRGLAVQAITALPDYVARHYPGIHTLYLTVNCRNTPAYHCYLKAGFKDTGDLYHGGPVGPQHIMNREVPGR